MQRRLPRTPRPKDSAARIWAPLASFIEAEARLGEWAAGRPVTHALYELGRFGVKQGWACLFGALLLALLIGTHLFYPKGAFLARYDFLVLAAVAIQIAMLAFKLETWEEAKVIFIFHVVGTVMEIFKTSVGSWLYPEPSLLRIGGVPLFSGFMYAAIGSYIARCWRLFDFRFTHHPPLWALSALATAIYINFFAHHYLPDARPALFALTVLLFGRCWIYFKVWRVSPAYAAAAGLRAGRGLHLVGGEYRHVHGRMDVPQPEARLVDGVDGQARRLVPPDDRQLHARCPAEPAGAL
jgi:uncharacterized membrane protein YoaT (DUF817 family)